MESLKDILYLIIIGLTEDLNSFNYLKKINGDINNINFNFDYLITKLVLFILKFLK